jgi:hypothetical protein
LNKETRKAEAGPVHGFMDSLFEIGDGGAGALNSNRERLELLETASWGLVELVPPIILGFRGFGAFRG